MLRKRPAISFIAIATLALAIGTNTAIFSVVYRVLLNPLPFTKQNELVVAWDRDTKTNTPFVELSVAEFKDWQEQNHSFQQMAVMPTTVYGYGYVLTDHGDPVLLESSKATGDFFSVLGATAAMGRTFDEKDDVANGPKVVVISDNVWRNRLGADPAIVGKNIPLNNTAYTVIGVMPPSFAFPKGVDLWTPLLVSMSPQAANNRGIVFLQMIGRLKPGVTRSQAESELNTILARIASEHSELQSEGVRSVVTPLSDYIFGTSKPALWTLFAAASLLLLIAAANIANLLLARATSRRKEFAVRLALGASRGEIIRQLVTESLILAVLGGVFGAVASVFFLKLFVSMAPADLPRLDEIGVDYFTLLYVVAGTFLTLAIFGLIPAISACRFNLNQTLVEASGRLGGSRKGNRLRNILVVSEFALCFVILISAALITRSFLNLSRVPLGFDPNNVLTMQMRLTGSRYDKVEARRQFFADLIARLESRPGIVSAAGVLIRPLEGTVGWENEYATEGQTPDEFRHNPVANYETITPHYFQTFGVPLKSGRPFDDHDKSDAPLVVIISEGLAIRHFGSAQSAIGKHITLGPSNSDNPSRIIVGVAGDVRYRELQSTRLDVYVPHAQSSPGLNHFAVRSNLDPTAALSVVRQEVSAIDPQQAVSRLATMDELVSSQLSRTRFSTELLGFLGVLAMVLSAIGIFGVMSYAVTERTREIGIRIALGASQSNVAGLVVREGLKLSLIGCVIGVVAASLTTRLLSDLLFGIKPIDITTFALVSAFLLAVSLIACYIPARRATGVDPMLTLRYE